MESDHTSPVKQLLSKGKIKDAVETAKNLFKHNPSCENQADLVAAYIARIDQMISRKELEAARTIIHNLLSRFPESKDACFQRSQRIEMVAFSPVDRAIQAFLAVEASPEGKAAATAALAKEIVDPLEVAESRVLPENHSLKFEARIISEAFRSAIRGKGISRFQDDLRKVQRGSPLAAWRRAIFGIDCFHRNDQENMAFHLSGLSLDVPIGIVGPALMALAGEHPFLNPPHTQAIFERLKEKILGDGRKIRSELSEVFEKIELGNLCNVLEEAGRLLPKLRRRFPEAFSDFSRHLISLVCEDGSEESRHTIQDLLFTNKVEHSEMLLWVAKSMVEIDPLFSALYLRENALTLGKAKFSRDEKAWLLKKSAVLLIGSGYDGLPGEPEPLLAGTALPKSTIDLLRKSLEFQHTADAHELLLSEMEVFEYSLKEMEREALLWHEKDPGNILPLLILVRRARRRKTLRKAIRFIEIAEQVDPIHPEIRNARVEILVETLEENLLKKNISTRSQKVIDDLYKHIPEEDKRRWYIGALAWAGRILSGSPPIDCCPFAPSLDATIKAVILNDLAVRFSIPGITTDSFNPGSDYLRFFVSLAKVIGGYLALDRSLSLAVLDNCRFTSHIPETAWDPAGLCDFCEGATRERKHELLFLLTGIGLRLGGSDLYKFLFYRGITWLKFDQARAERILAAAETLALKMNDEFFLNKIRDLLSESKEGDFGSFFRSLKRQKMDHLNEKGKLTSREISDLVECEKSAIFAQKSPSGDGNPLRPKCSLKAPKRPPTGFQQKFEW